MVAKVFGFLVFGFLFFGILEAQAGSKVRYGKVWAGMVR